MVEVSHNALTIGSNFRTDTLISAPSRHNEDSAGNSSQNPPQVSLQTALLRAYMRLFYF